jgi:hypothetical protein
MAKEVKIKLTDAQRAKIKGATGQEMSEIRVPSLGKNAAAKAVSARASEAMSMRSARDIQVARAALSQRASGITASRINAARTVTAARQASARAAAKAAAPRASAKAAAPRASAKAAAPRASAKAAAPRASAKAVAPRASMRSTDDVESF